MTLDIKEALEQAEVHAIVDKGVFNTLRDSALPFADSADPEGQWRDYLLPFEEKHLETFYAEDPTAKKKNGKWKISRLPNPWLSAKSVVANALREGLEFEGLGKTEIQRRVNEKKKEKRDTTTSKRRLLVRLEQIVHEANLLAPSDKVDFINDATDLIGKL